MVGAIAKQAAEQTTQERPTEEKDKDVAEVLEKRAKSEKSWFFVVIIFLFHLSTFYFLEIELHDFSIYNASSLMTRVISLKI